MLFTVYILHSKTKDRYYIGHTENLDKRIIEHNTRKNLGANDWALAYSERYTTRASAMAREKEIKSKKRRAYIEELIANR